MEFHVARKKTSGGPFAQIINIPEAVKKKYTQVKNKLFSKLRRALIVVHAYSCPQKREENEHGGDGHVHLVYPTKKGDPAGHPILFLLLVFLHFLLVSSQ